MSHMYFTTIKKVEKIWWLGTTLGYYRMWFCGFVRFCLRDRASLVVAPAAGAEVCRLSWAHTSKIINGSPGALSDRKAGLPESTDEARTQGAPTFLGGWTARVPAEARPARPRTSLLAPALRHAGHEGSSDSTGQPQRRSGSLESAPPPAHIRVQPRPAVQCSHGRVESHLQLWMYAGRRLRPATVTGNRLFLQP